MGLSFSRHSSVRGAFNKEFVHTGIFPREFSRNIERISGDRQIGDYGYEETVSKADSERDIADAEAIVRAIEEYLAEKNYL